MTLLIGCNGGADAFFSGRPFEMAMIHNCIISGSHEAMAELLKIPARLPAAKDSHIDKWQGSIIAWWRNPEKHDHIVASFSKISFDEMVSLEQWVKHNTLLKGKQRHFMKSSQL